MLQNVEEQAVIIRKLFEANKDLKVGDTWWAVNSFVWLDSKRIKRAALRYILIYF
jgi:hypothetical protein